MMRKPVPSSSDLVPPTWTVSDDQRALVTACQRFAQDQLEPLLAAPPSQADWRDIVTHASSLDLGTMILPTSLGGMAIGQHDLCGIVTTLACGPIERAVQLTQCVFRRT
ncbi:acyl-CoA dehydrogenase family protein [Burkholderia contaminans]|uniref:acyl-CoA dehydrogenase family protein n=1 Tax=Burkholderia contaminans TaxID=488447 RepID=UPI002D80AE63|nr:acyl-CoA dehydrogenase family protein [Burkholderia contaminans]